MLKYAILKASFAIIVERKSFEICDPYFSFILEDLSQIKRRKNYEDLVKYTGCA